MNTHYENESYPPSHVGGFGIFPLPCCDLKARFQGFTDQWVDIPALEVRNIIDSKLPHFQGICDRFRECKDTCFAMCGVCIIPNIHEKMIITSSLTRHFGEVDSHSTPIVYS